MEHKIAPFRTYRDGLPPTPGYFATARSIYPSGVPVRIGDLIVNKAAGTERGMVIGVYDTDVVYLIEKGDPRDAPNEGRPGNFFFCCISDAVVIGHAYDALREIVRIEALADARGAT